MTESESAPVCQTCGGSGSVPVQFARTVPDWRGEPTIAYDSNIDASPDCAGTGVPERAGDDEARSIEDVPNFTPGESPLTPFLNAARAGLIPPKDARSGDEPVTSPDLDAAAFKEWYASAHPRARSRWYAYRAGAASERAAAAERERGLREALELIAGAESLTAKGCARVAREALEKFHAAVSGEGEGQ